MASRINSDFKELVSALSSARVRFLVVGGVAVIEHTEPRYTKDLDVWVEPTLLNARRVVAALRRFGAPLAGVAAQDFTNPRLVYQMGVEPVRIDILMSLEGLTFAQAWRSRKLVRWGKVRVPVLSAEHLLLNKRNVGRPQDLVDADRLARLLRARKRK